MQPIVSNENKQILILSIGRMTFLSFEEKKIIEKNLDSFNDLALMSIEDISRLIHRDIKRGNWNGQENLKMAKMSKHYCDLLDIIILPYFDDHYPELLRQISDPPFLLFCRGNINLLSEKNVSIVGTRRLSPFGKESAFSFAKDAVNDGCNIISGLAYGADSWAHKGAVSAYFDAIENHSDVSVIGRTIAVIPSAIDEIVPASQKRLAAEILQSGGCIISEYEPKMSMATWHFVGRNRIIAGLSPATVVIEAPSGSGALITADFALEYNREVMFHEAAFKDIAKQVAQTVKSQLDIDFAAGKVSRYKIENNPKKFLDAGASIIKDYKDYCVCLREEPGFRNNQSKQQLLFEE